MGGNVSVAQFFALKSGIATDSPERTCAHAPSSHTACRIGISNRPPFVSIKPLRRSADRLHLRLNAKLPSQDLGGDCNPVSRENYREVSRPTLV